VVAEFVARGVDDRPEGLDDDGGLVELRWRGVEVDEGQVEEPHEVRGQHLAHRRGGHLGADPGHLGELGPELVTLLGAHRAQVESDGLGGHRQRRLLRIARRVRGGVAGRSAAGRLAGARGRTARVDRSFAIGCPERSHVVHPVRFGGADAVTGPGCWYGSRVTTSGLPPLLESASAECCRTIVHGEDRRVRGGRPWVSARHVFGTDTAIVEAVVRAEEHHEEDELLRSDRP